MSHLRLRLCLVIGALVALVGSANAFAAGNVVISQVYGGGGNAGATFKNDFIELHNRDRRADRRHRLVGAVRVGHWHDLAGDAARRAPSPPGGYYLVQEAAGAGGTTNLPTPDATGNIAMSRHGRQGGAGHQHGTLLTRRLPGRRRSSTSSATATANCSETAPTGRSTNTTAALRLNNGCTDTDNNSADFTIAAPTPRNSASHAGHFCADNAPASPRRVPANGARRLDRCDVSIYVQRAGERHGSLVHDLVRRSAAPTRPPSAAARRRSRSIRRRLRLGRDLHRDRARRRRHRPGHRRPAGRRWRRTTSSASRRRRRPRWPHVVVSEVYGGGGNAGATLTNDFIELYNRTGARDQPGRLVGAVRRRRPARRWQVTPLTGSIPAGRQLPVQEAAGAGGTTPLPTPTRPGIDRDERHGRQGRARLEHDAR